MQFLYKPVIILLPCRLLQLCAAAAGGPELAHSRGTPGASERREVRRLLTALQGPAAQHHSAPQQCEYNYLRRVARLDFISLTLSHTS